MAHEGLLSVRSFTLRTRAGVLTLCQQPPWALHLDELDEDPVEDQPGNRQIDTRYRQGDVVRYEVHGGGTRVELIGRLNERGGTCPCCSLERPVELLGNVLRDPALLDLLREPSAVVGTEQEAGELAPEQLARVLAVVRGDRQFADLTEEERDLAHALVDATIAERATQATFGFVGQCDHADADDVHRAELLQDTAGRIAVVLAVPTADCPSCGALVRNATVAERLRWARDVWLPQQPAPAQYTLRWETLTQQWLDSEDETENS